MVVKSRSSGEEEVAMEEVEGQKEKGKKELDRDKMT